MSLSKIEILPFYNTYNNNIIKEFYNKVFEYAKNYDRVSAYFDSKILALYACGIENIYKNNGKIRFVFSYDLSEYDFNLMKNGYQNRSLIEKKISDEIKYNDLSDEERVHFSNLAYLIETNLVDIKIAFTKQGIFHDKFGLIYDDDNTIYFRGSNNETYAAVLYSYESFETTCSWNNVESENRKLYNAKKTFERLWNNEENDIIVTSIPDIVRQKIISYSSKTFKNTEQNFYNNKLVFDLGINNKLLCKNFLSPNKIDMRDRIVKVFLKRYLLSTTNEELIFKDELTYLETKKIIDYFIDYSIQLFFDIYITDKLKEYLESIDIQIEKRKSLGIDIKEHNAVVENKFEQFEQHVNAEMERKLRPSQMWNSFHIVSMIKAANFSVPGSGKTSIVYGAFAYLNRNVDKKVDKIIMIGPKNSFMAWKDEFVANFGNKKTLKLLNIQDLKFRNREQIINALKYDSSNCNLILINYEMLPALEEVLKEIVNDRTMLIYDEIHKIKAINGVWATSAIAICKKAKYKVALTGTPIPNSYADIYNLFNILYYEEYNSFFKFTPIDLKNATDRTAAKINEQIYPFYCRTTKKDLDIPAPNIDDLNKVPMTKYEKQLFEFLRKTYRNNIFTLYIRLLQASTSPKLLLKKIDDSQLFNMFYDEEVEEWDESSLRFDDINKEANIENVGCELIEKIGETSKFKAGVELVNKLVSEGKQVVVWGVFVETLKNIAISLTNLNISSYVICGLTSQGDREQLINDFKNNKFQVLITNPHTLAESISLHKNCHDSVYFEYSFNLTHMLQSRDRINRLGLPENQYTQYYYLMLCNDDIYNDSIDFKTYSRLKEKEKIMLDSIEGTTLVRSNFDDADDIRKILENI